MIVVVVVEVVKLVLVELLIVAVVVEVVQLVVVELTGDSCSCRENRAVISCNGIVIVVVVVDVI